MITLAYIDPGVGLLAWQACIAFFVGLLFYLKKTRGWIVQVFRKICRVGRRSEEAPAAAPPSSGAARQ